MAITFLPETDNAADTSKTAKAKVMGKNMTFWSQPYSSYVSSSEENYKDQTMASIVQMANQEIGSHYLKLASSTMIILAYHLSV